MYDFFDEDDRSMFYDPGGESALRAGVRNQPCPTCRRKNKLTVEDVHRGYQCDDCAEGREITSAEDRQDTDDPDTTEDETVFVDMVASGYEWICPECQEYYKVSSWVEKVTCKQCGGTFETMPPMHPTG